MPTLNVQAELSADDLLKAVDQLEATELTQFVSRVLKLRARRLAPSVRQPEEGLLRRINEGLPPADRERYRELLGKRREETLAPEEHAELLRLTDQVELREADRAQALIELAQVRQVPLGKLMDDLGIRPASDD